MARAVYDFQSLNKKTAIGKRREAMSKEIIQFDDAMFETRLDALVKTRVEQIVNAMLETEATRSPTPADTSTRPVGRRFAPVTTNAG